MPADPPEDKMFLIEAALISDLAEILALQKSAFQTEAERYQDYGIAPLKQTREELQTEFHRKVFLKITRDRQIIGSVRGAVEDGVGWVERLMVHPDYRCQGLGAELVKALEAKFPETRIFRLGTGEKSASNIRLYQKLGYVIVARKPVNEKLTFCIMEKNLPG